MQTHCKLSYKFAVATHDSNTTAEKLYEAAVKALAHSARSTAEIRLLLEKRKASKTVIGTVLRRLRENGYLDDARFARWFVSARLENELQGPARVRQDLERRGVSPEIAREAVGRGFEAMEESDLLRRHIARKLRPSRPFSRPSAVVSIHRRLLRAGFASDTIVRELKRMLRASLSQSRPKTDPADWEKWDELLESLAEMPEPEAEIDR